MRTDKKITIFTPTFNRGYILNQLYESLINQTNQKFIWSIVDDGSNDNTKELVQSWIFEKKIEIFYYPQKNGGKQRAHNKGVEQCETELFLCVDSDDYLVENAIEELVIIWESLTKNPGFSSIAGVVALRGSDKNTPIGTNFPEKVVCSSLTALYRKYHFKGDTVLLYRTKILKEYPFNVVDGEYFIGEGYVYSQIDQKYELFILNKILYICGYLSDGYTTNIRQVIKNNPKGYMLLNKQNAEFEKNIWWKFIYTIKYRVGCILAKEKYPMKNNKNKVLLFLAYLPAYIYIKKNYNGE